MSQPTATEPKSEQDQVMEKLMTYTASQLMAGKKPAQVQDDLMTQGVPSDLASQIVAAVNDYKKKAVRKSGVKMFFTGIVMAGIGAAITIGSFSSASSGGHYVVTYGLIAVGLVYALAGGIRMLTGWNIK